MHKSIWLYLSVVTLFAIISCSDTQNPAGPGSKELIYPLEIGNEWTSIRLFSLENYRPLDTTVLPPRDTTLLGRSFVTVSRSDTISDSIATFVLVNILEEDGASFSSESYYTNRDDGLYFVAYRNPGYSIPKSQSKGIISFKGRSYQSVGEITSYLTSSGKGTPGILDTLIVEDPPLKSLPRKYSVNDQWTYRESGNPHKYDKKIIGREVIKTHAGDYECYKVQWLIDLNDDGLWDDDLGIVDWIAPEGLIRRFTFYRDLTWSGPDDPGPIGVFDSKEEYYLTDIKIR